MKNDDVIKWYRLFIDDVIEDIKSYIETESNLSYQDELHARLLEFGSQFLLSEIKRAREECYEQMDEIIGKDCKENGDYWNITHWKCENAVRAIQRSKLQALKEEL